MYLSTQWVSGFICLSRFDILWCATRRGPPWFFWFRQYCESEWNNCESIQIFQYFGRLKKLSPWLHLATILKMVAGQGFSAYKIWTQVTQVMKKTKTSAHCWIAFWYLMSYRNRSRYDWKAKRCLKKDTKKVLKIILNSLRKCKPEAWIKWFVHSWGNRFTRQCESLPNPKADLAHPPIYRP